MPIRRRRERLSGGRLGQPTHGAQIFAQVGVGVARLDAKGADPHVRVVEVLVVVAHATDVDQLVGRSRDPGTR